MRKVAIILLFLACALPLAVAAPEPMMSTDVRGYGMMQTIEERSMNATAHEEMGGLMERMMEENMTPAEQDRLVELMHEYPAGYSMMLQRMTGTNYCGQLNGEFWQGMPYYSWMLVMMPVAMILGGLFLLVWLVVGVLATIWLLRQIRRL